MFLNFWRGKKDNAKNIIAIQRIKNGKSTILYNDFVRDDTYDVLDLNNDCFLDFITYYHDYDVIYLFDKKANQFMKTPEYIPNKFEMVDKVRKIYWGYRVAQYNEKYDYSILYKYDNTVHPYYYYKMVFKTLDPYSERKDAAKIILYKFVNGRNVDDDSLIFIKEIKTKNPATFDYKSYWMQYYKSLLGFR